MTIMDRLRSAVEQTVSAQRSRVDAADAVLATFAPRTHDYGPGMRSWGHDYTFSPQNNGQRGTAMGWGRGIRAGDFLLLQNRDRSTRYRVDSIRYYLDPDDMWSAVLSFAPRKVVDG